MNPIVPSQPGWPANSSDIGGGTLAPQGNVMSAETIENICKGALATGDAFTALMAQLLQTNSPSSCIYSNYPITLSPSVATSPAGGLVVVQQQILPYKATRKSLGLAWTQTATFNPGSNNVAAVGVVKQSGPNVQQTLQGKQAAQVVALAELFTAPMVRYYSPCPQNAITVIAVYGAAAMQNIAPISLVVFEGF